MALIPSQDVPQANRLRTVADLLALVGAGITDKDELVKQLQLVEREVDYYKLAARILGLVTPDKRRFELSEKGQALLRVKTPEELAKILGEAVRSAVIFKELLTQYEPAQLTRQKIVEFLRQRTEVKGSTVGRRASTIIAWLAEIRIWPENAPRRK
jgi:hypothetical protein